MLQLVAALQIALSEELYFEINMSQFTPKKCGDLMTFLRSGLLNALIKEIPNIVSALQPERTVLY